MNITITRAGSTAGARKNLSRNAVEGNTVEPVDGQPLDRVTLSGQRSPGAADRVSSMAPLLGTVVGTGIGLGLALAAGGGGGALFNYSVAGALGGRLVGCAVSNLANGRRKTALPAAFDAIKKHARVTSVVGGVAIGAAASVLAVGAFSGASLFGHCLGGALGGAIVGYLVEGS